MILMMMLFAVDTVRYWFLSMLLNEIVEDLFELNWDRIRWESFQMKNEKEDLED